MTRLHLGAQYLITCSLKDLQKAWTNVQCALLFSSTDHNVPRSLHDEAWLGGHAWRGSLGHGWGVLLHVHAGVSLVKNRWCVSYSGGNRGVWSSGRERRGRRVGDGCGGLDSRRLGDFNRGKRRSPTGHRHWGTIDLSMESSWPGGKVLRARGLRCSMGHVMSFQHHFLKLLYLDSPQVCQLPLTLILIDEYVQGGCTIEERIGHDLIWKVWGEIMAWTLSNESIRGWTIPSRY